MKLLRVGAPGAEAPALLAADGTIRDLSAHVRDVGGAVLSPAGLAGLAMLDPASLPAVAGAPRIGSCVERPVNFVCIGLNYADHAAEAGMAIPKEPIVFLKSLSVFISADSGPRRAVDLQCVTRLISVETHCCSTGYGPTRGGSSSGAGPGGPPSRSHPAAPSASGTGTGARQA